MFFLIFFIGSSSEETLSRRFDDDHRYRDFVGYNERYVNSEILYF